MMSLPDSPPSHLDTPTTGNLESAGKHLQQCLRADPDNGAYVSLTKQVRLLEARKKAGDEAFKRGAYEEAVAAWTECLGVDPSLKAFNAKLYNNRATAFGKLRRHQEAVDDCGQAIALEPGYVKAFRRRAESLYAMGGASFVLMRVRALAASNGEIGVSIDGS